MPTSEELVTIAMSFISDPQRGQISGLSLSASRPPSRRENAPAGQELPPETSTTYTFAISLAHAERQTRSGTVSVWAGAG